MPYTFLQKVLFKHCDPAGIVFYPRYFEILNDAIEDWFANGLETPWEKLHLTNAIPTVQIEVQFKAPSYHSDILELRIAVQRAGTSSLTIRVEAFCGEELRFTATSTLVHVDLEKTPEPWPQHLRSRLELF